MELFALAVTLLRKLELAIKGLADCRRNPDLSICYNT